MRIFIMGPVGVGKSHAVSYLEGLGYEVSPDPVIALGEDFLSGDDSLAIQASVATSLFSAATTETRTDVIFDSCLMQSYQFVRANRHLGYISGAERERLRELYTILTDIAYGPSDVFIYLDKPIEVIDEQIAQRGRPYEQDNPFIKTSNELVREDLVASVRNWSDNVYVVDVSGGYEPLTDLIEKLQGGSL